MKKNMIMAAIGATGIAAAVYFFLRKRNTANTGENMGNSTGNKIQKHLTNVFSRAKTLAHS